MPSKKKDDEVNSSPQKKGEPISKPPQTGNVIPVPPKKVSLSGQDPEEMIEAFMKVRKK